MNEVTKIKKGLPLSVAPQMTAEAIRLGHVYNDFGGTQQAFADLFGITQASISRMMNGRQPIPLNVISVVCFKLGYSAAWFITGAGNRKADKVEGKLVTEISMLRTEMEIMLAKNSMMEARMKSYENEINEIKNSLKSV